MQFYHQFVFYTEKGKEETHLWFNTDKREVNNVITSLEQGKTFGSEE
jgi:hypothetical protein